MTEKAKKGSAALLAAAVLGGLGVAIALIISGDAATVDDKTIFCTEFVPNEEASSPYTKWASQNSGEKAKWITFRTAICASQSATIPVMATAFGKALVAAGKMALPEDPPPTTTTSTTTTTTTTTPPPAANLYVSLAGSDSNSCTQSSPCRSLPRAYQAASCGSVIEVAAGGYGDQTFGGGAGKACAGNHVIMRPAPGATVTLGRIFSDGPGWIELNGFKIAARIDLWGGTGHWRILNNDGGSFDIGQPDVFMSGNDWGPCETNGPINCSGQNFIGNGGANLVIDGDTFHDYVITPLSGSHWECIFVNGSTGNVVIRNSRFWNCHTYAIFFTSFLPSHQYNGTFTVENNWFGSTCCFGSNTRNSAINLGTDAGSPLRNLLIRFNSFAPGQTLVKEGGVTGTNVRAVGNIFGESYCVAGVTYAFNIVIGASPCASGLAISSAPYVNPSNGAAGNYHLNAGTQAEGFVTPTTADYALGLDYDRQPRTAPRDAGSDER